MSHKKLLTAQILKMRHAIIVAAFISAAYSMLTACTPANNESAPSSKAVQVYLVPDQIAEHEIIKSKPLTQEQEEINTKLVQKTNIFPDAELVFDPEVNSESVFSSGPVSKLPAESKAILALMKSKCKLTALNQSREVMNPYPTHPEEKTTINQAQKAEGPGCPVVLDTKIDSRFSKVNDVKNQKNASVKERNRTVSREKQTVDVKEKSAVDKTDVASYTYDLQREVRSETIDGQLWKIYTSVENLAELKTKTNGTLTAYINFQSLQNQTNASSTATQSYYEMRLQHAFYKINFQIFEENQYIKYYINGQETNLLRVKAMIPSFFLKLAPFVD